MSAAEAVQNVRNGTLTLIDVREKAELKASGKAVGALHIPLVRLRDMADPRHPDFHPGLKDSTAIALYCASGGRSHNGEMVLRQLGYEDVHNIGGLGHWVQAGGDVEPA